jgi:hypothetical protein
MKIHVVHDAKGMILAAIQLNSDPKAPQLRPMPGRGHAAMELELSSEQSAMDFKTLCTNHGVDKKPKMLIGAKKPKR